MRDVDNIYSFPVSERKNKFLELLSRTSGDTNASVRRETILKEMKGKIYEENKAD